MHGMRAATSKVENSAQGSSCRLKFVHVPMHQKYTIVLVGHMSFGHLPFGELTFCHLSAFLLSEKNQRFSFYIFIAFRLILKIDELMGRMQ